MSAEEKRKPSRGRLWGGRRGLVASGAVLLALGALWPAVTACSTDVLSSAELDAVFTVKVDASRLEGKKTFVMPESVVELCATYAFEYGRDAEIGAPIVDTGGAPGVGAGGAAGAPGVAGAAGASAPDADSGDAGVSSGGAGGSSALPTFCFSIDHESDQAVLDAFRKNLEARGFTEVPASEALDADLALTAGWVARESWGLGPGYPHCDPFPGYFGCWYPDNLDEAWAVPPGSLIFHLVDRAASKDAELRVIWSGVLHSLLLASEVAEKAEEDVAAAFAQSPWVREVKP